MLFRTSFTLAVLAAQTSALYFFPTVEDKNGQQVLAEPWRQVPVTYTIYSPPRAQAVVRPLIANVSAERLRGDLETFTSFKTRHAPTKSGRESQLWLVSQLNKIAAEYTIHGPLVTVFEFEHKAFGQRSIIARIHGSNITADDSIVILGAHQDSKNYREPEERSPGADDDGSGTVTILEAFRQLAKVGYAPAKTLELHWYAAEEGGLLGSKEVAAAYRAQNKTVAAMAQYDMTAWVKNGTDEAIGIVSSDVDMGLVALQVQLVAEYLDLPSVVYKFPPVGGSDHMSWFWQGYPSSFLTEGLFPNMNLANIHTPNDRIDISPEFSFEHMRRFAQHAVAFAIEVGGGQVAK